MSSSKRLPTSATGSLKSSSRSRTPNADTPATGLLGPIRNVVAQPTDFCNVNCAYCYLPGRNRRHLMSVKVAEAIAEGIREQNAPKAVNVIWHGGEPLATGHGCFEQLLQPFEALREEKKVVFSLQTNGTLIDERWCDLIARYQISVGVSVDGPKHLNASRRDRAGREIFDEMMRGIDRLRDAGIPFTVIAVVSPETIGHADEILDFMSSTVKPVELGINIEQRTGANETRPVVSREAAEGFWGSVIRHQLRSKSQLRVRELAGLAQYLEHARRDQAISPRKDPIPTVSYDGKVVVLSPEFVGTKAPEYDDFVVGNVLSTPLHSIIQGLDQVPYVNEYATAVRKCRASCSLWDACQGAFAANRWFEHHDLTVAETARCRNSRQAVALALLAVTREAPTSDATEELTNTLARLTQSLG